MNLRIAAQFLKGGMKQLTRNLDRLARIEKDRQQFLFAVEGTKGLDKHANPGGFAVKE